MGRPAHQPELGALAVVTMRPVTASGSAWPLSLKVTILLAAATAAVGLSGDVLGASASPPVTEVVVTLKAPPLAAFGRTAGHARYAAQLGAAQTALARRIATAVPGSQVRWRFTHVLAGLAVVLPRSALDSLAAVPGVAEVWPSVRYHALREAGSPQQIGADKLW